MFDAVARRYDLTNTVLSLGQDRFWRRATRSALRIGPGDKVLDLAAGTAVSTVELATSGAWCVAADFSVGMLAAGAAHARCRRSRRTRRELPFDDGVFDAVTISFGLRNVVDHAAGSAGDGAGDAAGWPAGGVRVLDADEPAVRDGLQGVPDAGAAADRARGVVEPGRLCLSRRVDPRVARPSPNWRAGSPTRAGRRCGGATSPAASSRCTRRPNRRADSFTSISTDHYALNLANVEKSIFAIAFEGAW